MDELCWDRGFALEQAADDEEVLKELLELFRVSAGSDLAKIKTAVSAGDSEGLRQAAHSLKGAAASLGFEGIRTLAHELELAGREGRALEMSRLASLENLLEEAWKLD